MFRASGTHSILPKMPDIHLVGKVDHLTTSCLFEDRFMTRCVEEYLFKNDDMFLEPVSLIR